MGPTWFACLLRRSTVDPSLVNADIFQQSSVHACDVLARIVVRSLQACSTSVKGSCSAVAVDITLDLVSGDAFRP
jgi:hypothetical protein